MKHYFGRITATIIATETSTSSQPFLPSRISTATICLHFDRLWRDAWQWWLGRFWMFLCRWMDKSCIQQRQSMKPASHPRNHKYHSSIDDDRGWGKRVEVRASVRILLTMVVVVVVMVGWASRGASQCRGSDTKSNTKYSRTFYYRLLIALLL